MYDYQNKTKHKFEIKSQKFEFKRRKIEFKQCDCKFKVNVIYKKYLNV